MQHPCNGNGWIDSHTHLDLVRDRHGHLPSLAPLRAVLTISTKRRHALSLQEFCAYPNVYRTVGIHPDHAHEITDWEWLRQACAKKDPKLLAIGEIGLDATISTPMAQQIDAFSTQLQIAGECGLPVVLHARDAETETLNVLKKYPHVRGVGHCFTGSIEFAQSLVELGWYVSFSGILTFKSASQLREVPRHIPLSRILVETDAPYLAPDPLRSKLNHSEYVKYTGEKLAEILGLSVGHVKTATSKNFERLFGVGGSLSSNSPQVDDIAHSSVSIKQKF